MKIGTTEIAGIKLGTLDVIKAYQGTTLVYSQGDPYIQTDGNSWIESGSNFFPSAYINTSTTTIGSTTYNVYNTLTMEITYLLPNETNEQHILGANMGSEYGWFSLRTENNKSDFQLGGSSTLVSHSIDYETELNETYMLGWSWTKWSDNTYSANRIVKVTKTDGSTAGATWTDGTIPSRSIRLFGSHYGGAVMGIFAGQRIYGLKLWSKQFMISDDKTEVRDGDETLILNLVPAKKDGQGCLRDKLTDTYYTNQGTGTMTYVG